MIILFYNEVVACDVSLIAMHLLEINEMIYTILLIPSVVDHFTKGLLICGLYTDLL